METWATQDELGKQLGIDAQAVGQLLVVAGLKAGREATDDALDRGLAEPDMTPLGRPFVRWRSEEVLPLLMPLAEQMKAAAATESKAGARRKPAGKQPATGQPASRKSVRGVAGTTFDVVVALHAFAEPNPGPTGWAYVNQETWETTTGGLPNGTDREGELVGALELLDHVAPEAHLLVRSSSENLVRTATMWAPSWRRSGWKMRDGQPPQHLDLLKALMAKIDGRKGRTRFGLGAPDDELIMAAAQAAVVAARGQTA